MNVAKSCDSMLPSLKGKLVLVTGGSGAIGFQVALACARQGASIVLTARSSSRAQKFAQKITETGFCEESVGLELDCSSPQGIDIFLEMLGKKKLRPDAFVHCARSVDSLNTVEGRPPWDNWLAEYSVDVAAPYRLAAGLLEPLARSGHGAVVLVSSIYGATAVNPNLYDNPSLAAPIHYSVAKAAVIQLSKELAVRFSPHNVRVNSIAYGGVAGRVSDEFKQRYSKLCPSGRMLEPGEVGAPAVFLLSEGASGMTGHNLIVDGGWTTW